MEIRAAYDLPRNGKLKRPVNKLAVLDIVLNPERGGGGMSPTIKGNVN